MKFEILYTEYKSMVVEAESSAQAEEKFLALTPTDPGVMDTEIYEIDEIKMCQTCHTPIQYGHKCPS